MNAVTVLYGAVRSLAVVFIRVTTAPVAPRSQQLLLLMPRSTCTSPSVRTGELKDNFCSQSNIN